MGQLVTDAAAIRLSLGRTTTATEIDRAVRIVPLVVERVRVSARA
jgi:cysteine sulfinate desulfinase/cysteine desulfurase-like protein